VLLLIHEDLLMMIDTDYRRNFGLACFTVPSTFKTGK